MISIRSLSVLGLSLGLMLGVACSSVANAADDTPVPSRVEGQVHDPLEPMNRAVDGFNSVVDHVLLAPTARVYKGVVPEVVRGKVTNALSNLNEPVNMLNALLQGDVEHAFVSFWRFTLNSTFGIAGLFDFAETNARLIYRREDFGQTLGYYGVGTGPYLVLPILGPSNLRDVVGLAVDIVSNPFTWLLDSGGNLARGAASAIDLRARMLPYTDDVEASSFDPYATYRSSYTQFRTRLVKEARVPAKHRRYYYAPQCEHKG